MATNTPQEELKRQALNNLAVSRDEIVAGVRQLRSDLSPKILLHRLVDRHTGAVIFVAAAVGVVSSMMVLRRKGSLRSDGHSKPRAAEASGVLTTIGSQMLRGAARLVLPAVIRSTVVTSLYGSMARSKS